MVYDLCRRYQLGEREREERLALVGLEHADHRWANVLRERVVRPHLQSVVAHTRAILRRKQSIGRWALDPATFVDVHRKQAQALPSIGADFDTEGYFAARLHAALACFTRGVPLHVCLVMQHAELEALAGHLPHDHREELIEVLHKLFTLDASLFSQVFEHELRRETQQAWAAERATRRRAGRDSVTGVITRASIEEHVHRAVDAAGRRGVPLSVLVVDVDYFKRINDEHGHPVGDVALRQVTARMQSALREGDWIGRYGGDEFLVVLRNTDAPVAMEVAERLRQHVAQNAHEIDGRMIAMTVSVGVAQLRHAELPRDLIARADVAMYEAKRSGRNRVVAAGSSTSFRHEPAA